MRISLLTGFVLLFISAAAQSDIDVLHYKFNIQLSDNSDTIYGAAEINFKFRKLTSSFTIQLAFQNNKGQGMIIDKIQTLAGPSVKSFERINDDVNVQLEALAKPNDDEVLIIVYHGSPKDGLIISKNIYGDRTFFADNWPNRAHNWIPCVDDPSDKATFEFIVTAPSQYQVVSNGIPEEEKLLDNNKKLTRWKEGIPLSTKVMVIGVAKFAVKEYTDSPPGIPVSAWVYPRDSVKGFQNYSYAPSIVKFFSDYIAPYPYEKLANVQSKTIFGGMENASAIFYYEASASSNRSVEDLLAHEIAHQWFGDMASEKSFAHLWLSEGFATYFTDIYFENKYGRDSMNYRLRSERESAVAFAKNFDHPVVDSTSPFMNLLNANSYQKGAWVLHMLRQEMGDDIFKKFIRSYYETFKGKNADTEDLEKIAEETSHKNLRRFFRQWLYQPGIPQLAIRWYYDEKNKKLKLTISQIQKQEPYELPLEIRIQFTNGKASVETIHLSNREQIIELDVKDPVADIHADPFLHLLFEGTVKKTKN